MFSFWFRIPSVIRIVFAVGIIFAVIGSITAPLLHLTSSNSNTPTTSSTSSTASHNQSTSTSVASSKPSTTTKSTTTTPTTTPTTTTPSTTTTKSGGSSTTTTPPSSGGGGTTTGGGGGTTGGGTGGTGGGTGGTGGGTTSSYPTANTTGPSGCSSYTQYSGTYTVSTNGTTVNCLQLNGTLDVEASNVTISNSILTGTSWWGVRFEVTNTAATGLTLTHDKIQTVAGQGPDNGGYDYGVSPEGNGYITVAYSDISGYKDGIDISSGYVHDNYIHKLSQFTGSHSQDMYVWSGGSGVDIEHNTLINDTPISQASAAVYIAPDSGHQNNITLKNNELAGGANAVYGGDSTATNIVVENNVFSTQIFANCGYYGTDAYWQAGNTGVIWSGNTWYDGPSAGKTVDA